MADKIAIVTGGRRGIGRSISIELAKIGFNILVVDLERDTSAEATLVAIQTSASQPLFARPIFPRSAPPKHSERLP